MPPRRSSRKTNQSSSTTPAAPAPKKRNTRSSKAKADVDVLEAEHVVEETSATTTTTAKTAKDLVEGVKDVAEGAKDFVEEMDNTKVVEEIRERDETQSRAVDNENEEGREDGDKKQAQGLIESQSQREDESGQKETDGPGLIVDVNVNGNANQVGDDDGQSRPTTTTTGMNLEERKKKLDELRNRMRDSTRHNLSALRAESTKSKATAREAARREKQLRLAETLRLKTEAEERGEDVERKQNWEWTVEENEEWERKKRRKQRNADFEFHDEEQAARKRYKKDLAFLKPDLETYNKQKQLALGGAPGTPSNALTTFDPSGGAGQVTSYEQQRAAESLYRDANTLLYADNKPSEEAIDRVVEKLNLEQDKRNKFSRKRLNEDEGDITYINERNRVFNKKIARYYDKYTAEIRASFERGTAL